MRRSCRYIFETMDDSDLWISDIPLIEKQWTKPIVFQRLGVSHREDILNSNQIQGGFVGVRKSKQSVELIREWLINCCDKELLLPLSEDEEKGECIAHREDQSLLSVLSKIKGIKCHKDPTQYGRIPEKYKGIKAIYSVPAHVEDEYPVIILLHRTGVCDLKIIFKQWLNIVLPEKLVYKLIK